MKIGGIGRMEQVLIVDPNHDALTANVAKANMAAATVMLTPKQQRNRNLLAAANAARAATKAFNPKSINTQSNAASQLNRQQNRNLFAATNAARAATQTARTAAIAATPVINHSAIVENSATDAAANVAAKKAIANAAAANVKAKATLSLQTFHVLDTMNNLIKAVNSTTRNESKESLAKRSFLEQIEKLSTLVESSDQSTASKIKEIGDKMAGDYAAAIFQTNRLSRNRTTLNEIEINRRTDVITSRKSELQTKATELTSLIENLRAAAEKNENKSANNMSYWDAHLNAYTAQKHGMQHRKGSVGGKRRTHRKRTHRKRKHTRRH